MGWDGGGGALGSGKGRGKERAEAWKGAAS